MCGWVKRGWPGRGPFSYLPPWERPGWFYGPMACWWFYAQRQPYPIGPKPTEELTELEAYLKDLKHFRWFVEKFVILIPAPTVKIQRSAGRGGGYTDDTMSHLGYHAARHSAKIDDVYITVRIKPY